MPLGPGGRVGQKSVFHGENRGAILAGHTHFFFTRRFGGVGISVEMSERTARLGRPIKAHGHLSRRHRWGALIGQLDLSVSGVTER